MKIHCINLERATERKEQILKDWNGYDIEFFPAVDRRNLSDVYESQTSIEFIGRPLTPGERACCYSHFNLLDNLLKTNDSHFLVIEDDARPIVESNVFNQTIDTCINYIKGEEIIILFEPYLHNSHEVSKVDGDFLYLTGNKLWGTYGMLYTRLGAKKMLSYLKEMRGPADAYWEYFGREELLLKHKISVIKHIGNTFTYIEKTYRGNLERRRKFIS